VLLLLQLVSTAEPQHQPWCGPQWVVAAACLTLKGGRTDWLVEKATELGAHSLLPLITARSQTGTNKDRFKALAQKAGQNKRQRTGADEPSSSLQWGQESGSSSGGGDFQASRLKRLAVAATKQSLRTHGLQVQPAVSLEQLLPQLQAAPVSLVAMGGAPPVLQVLQQQWQQAQKQVQPQREQQAPLAGGAKPHASGSSHPW
jgi:16S rRNA (uracil1498-N3)-methyltransferase